MADLGEAVLTLTTDSSGLNKGIDSAKSSAADLAATFTGVGTALTLGVTAPIIAMGAMAVENFDESAKAAARLDSVLKSTGGAAGKTAEELIAMSSVLEKNSLFGDDEILQKVTNQLLTFTRIVGPAFDRAQQAAIDLSTALGQDLQSSAIQLGKALNDPIAGLTALKRVGVTFTETQKDMITAMVEAGDIMGAQNIILKEMEKEFGGAGAAAAAAGTGPFTVLWHQIENLTESWGELIVDAIKPFISIVTKVMDAFASLSPQTQKMILVFAALAAAIGPVSLAIGAVIAAIGLISGPVVIAVAAIGGLVAAFAAFPKFRAAVVGVIANIIKNVVAMGSQMGSLGMAIWSLAHGKFSEAWDIMKDSTAKATKDANAAIARLETGFKELTVSVKTTAVAHTNFGTGLTNDFIPPTKASKEEIKKLADQMEAAQKIVSTNARDMGKVYKENLDSMDAKNKEFSASLGRDIKQWDANWDEYDKTLHRIAGTTQTVVGEFVRPLNTIDTFAGLLLKPLPPESAIMKAPEMSKEAAAALKQATEDVKNSAGEIFDAMFIKGENVFSSLGNLLKGGALSLGRSIFEDITGALLGPVKKAFDDFFTAMLESTGIKSFISGLGDKLGGMLSGLFGGGGGAVSSVAGGATSAAGAATSAAGSAASAAGSAFSGLAGGIAGGVIAGLGSFLGSMRLEGTMNAVEANTRFTYIELKDTMEQILWPMHGFISFLADQSTVFVNQLDAIHSQVYPLNDRGLETVSAIDRAADAIIAVINARPPLVINVSPSTTVRELLEQLQREVEFGSSRLPASAVLR